MGKIKEEVCALLNLPFSKVHPFLLIPPFKIDDVIGLLSLIG